MAFVEVQTKDGPRKIRVCDYCKTVCIPPRGTYCSGYCARAAREQRERAEKTEKGGV